MRNFDHLLPTTPDECQRELARILATALLRKLRRVPIPPGVATAKNPENSSSNCLELPANPSVTVRTG